MTKLTSGRILTAAVGYLGCLYRWGAEGPTHFDCSGLINRLARDLGTELPGDHTAAMQYAVLRRVVKPRPGNLAYWATARGRIFHVAVVERVDGLTVHTIGAHRGNKTTTNDERAREQGASVQRRAFPMRGIYGYTLFPGVTMEAPEQRTIPVVEPDDDDELPEDFV